MKEIISKYGTFIIAVIALIQPWIAYLWKIFFRQAKIEIFPTGPIEVGFSQFGPTIGLQGTLSCLNRDIFVSSIALKVIREKDNSTHNFEWGAFRSQKLTHKGEEAEIELPYGFMLTTSQPKRYNIVFFDNDVRYQMQDELQKVQVKWQDFSKDTLLTCPETLPKKYYDEFSKTEAHVEAFSAISRLCYWEEGSYLLILKIFTSNPSRVFKRKWRFRLKKEEVENIRLNTVKILGDICIIASYGLYNFAYPKYEEF